MRRVVPSAVIAAAVALGACSFGSSGERRDVADDTVSVGVGVEEPVATTTPPNEASTAAATAASPPPSAPEATAPAQPAGTKGALDVLVASPAGRAAPGVPITVQGPTGGPLPARTAADGHLRADLPAGRYQLTIAPSCDSTIEVRTSARATVAVAAGQVASGVLQVEWRRRFGPGGKTTYKAIDPGEDRGRRWQVGRRFAVRFTLVDRCDGDAPAPGRRLSPFRLDGAATMTVDAVSASDGAGIVTATVRCTTEDDELELTAADPAQPEDAWPLFDRAALDDSPPSCEA